MEMCKFLRETSISYILERKGIKPAAEVYHGASKPQTNSYIQPYREGRLPVRMEASLCLTIHTEKADFLSEWNLFSCLCNSYI